MLSQGNFHLILARKRGWPWWILFFSQFLFDFLSILLLLIFGLCNFEQKKPIMFDLENPQETQLNSKWQKKKPKKGQLPFVLGLFLNLTGNRKIGFFHREPKPNQNLWVVEWIRDVARGGGGRGNSPPQAQILATSLEWIMDTCQKRGGSSNPLGFSAPSIKNCLSKLIDMDGFFWYFIELIVFNTINNFP